MQCTTDPRLIAITLSHSSGGLSAMGSMLWRVSR